MNALTSLATEAVSLAIAKGVTVGTAESLTAGLIAATLANVPGASAMLMGGIISYDPRVKHRLLQVSQDVIDGVGVVSEPCARQMAQGALAALAVDIALSATGLAGPGGGSEQTPVGTVFIGCASARSTAVREYRFTGDRQAVREQAVQSALQLLLDTLQA